MQLLLCIENCDINAMIPILYHFSDIYIIFTHLKLCKVKYGI